MILFPVENVISELNQANPAAAIPAVLNNVIGKTCAFDIKISSYNTNLGYEEYTVIKLSEYDLVENEPIAGPGGAAAEEQNVALITKNYLQLLNKTWLSTMYA